MNNELMRADAGPPALLDAEVGQRLSGREVLDTLFRQKWKILLLWSAVVIAAVAYIFLTPRMYESDMTILVKDKRVDVALGPEGGEKSDLGASDSQVATEIQLLSSRELSEWWLLSLVLRNLPAQSTWIEPWGN